MSRNERIVAALGLAVFAAILALAFQAYSAPGLIVEFATFIGLCG